MEAATMKSGKLTVARTTQTHPSQQCERTDREYFSLRLAGLAALVDSASKNGADMIAINDDVAFFIATTLEEIAERLVRG
jgi:hypothetical protein